MARKIKYYLVAAEALPEIFIRVAEAKRMMQTGEADTVGDATKKAVLSIFAGSGANILTINQSIPTNGCAAVTISAETSAMEKSLEQLITDISALDNVIKFEILAG